MRLRQASLCVLSGIICATASPLLAEDAPRARWSTPFAGLGVDDLPSVRFAREASVDDIPPVRQFNGSFAVVACTFRHPDAARMARDVAREIRADLGRPVYLDERYEAVSVLVAGGKDWGDTEALRETIQGLRLGCLAGTPESGSLRHARSLRYPTFQHTILLADGPLP